MFGLVKKAASSWRRNNAANQVISIDSSSDEDEQQQQQQQQPANKRRKVTATASHRGVAASTPTKKKKKKRVVMESSDSSETEGDVAWRPSKLKKRSPRKQLARKATARKRNRVDRADKKKATIKKRAPPATSASSPAIQSPSKSAKKRWHDTSSDSEASPQKMSASDTKPRARRPLHQQQRSVSPNGDDDDDPSHPPTGYRSARAERGQRIKSEDKTREQARASVAQHEEPVGHQQSAAATGEDDDFDPDDPQTASKFASHCWRCEWRIKQDDNDDGPCLYQLHVHPLLQVPCCSLCCELAASIDVPSDQNKATACCACNNNDDTGSLLLLCDTCPRVFCETCVEQAWGEHGAAHVKRITRDPDMSWACLVCSPPEALQKLQIKDTKDGGESQETAEQVVERLTQVEEELERLEEVLTEDHFQRVRREKERELNGGDAAAVDQEMKEWKEEHLKHYDLCQDTKVDLLERLDAFGICADKFYKYQKKTDAAKTEDADSTWKHLADKVLDERDMERRPIRDSSSSDNDDDSDQEQEALAHVEDLCTSSQLEDWETDEIVENRSRWNKHGHSREWLDKKLSKHLKRDDELLKQAGTRLIKVGTVSDEKETQREVAEASFRSSSGVTIRRDEIQTLVARKKPKTPAASAGATQKKVSLGARREASVLSSPFASPSKASGQRLSRSGPPILSPSKAAHGRRFFKIENSVSEHPNSWDSCFELASAKGGGRAVRVIAHLASQLKPHQVDGVRFLWENSCKDLETVTTRAQAREERDVGGCICAHMMGLGKSLQVVTLVHTLLNNPNLRPQRGNDTKPFVGRILLIVPVNTIANWNNEFDKWTKDTNSAVQVYDVSTLLKEARSQLVLTWSRRGGVLLVGSDMYTRLIKNDPRLARALQAGPEMVIIDEAHTLLKNETSQISKTLGPIGTKRRIILSGTPFVNNLKEYHKLSDWVRPGVFGLLSQFERSFANPIMEGLASDASLEQVALQVKKTKLLYKTLEPFMQRRDIGILKRDLPPSQTVVLYIRPSKLQARLYTAFKRFKKRLGQAGEDLPFLTEYQMLRPLHNHPYCLVSSARRRNGSLVQAAKRPPAKVQGETDSLKTASSNTAAAIYLVDSDADGTPTVGGVASKNAMLKPDTKPIPAEVAPKATTTGRGRKSMDYSWIEKIVPTTDDLSKVAKVEYGNKIFLLLQILAHAQSVDDKVVVFSQCLKTLDFIETVLKGDWASYCSGHEDNIHLGHWKKGSDYLRIDGSTQSSERGDLVSTFHENAEESKLFLLSIEAGGIGINLVAANRVVLFDNHWNPTVSSQAFHRCYRYGQQKPVYGYRLITHGTMEEKIFSRSMNKTGIAARVVDQKYPERNFTARELAEIKEMDSWVQCETCEKWRMLFMESDNDLPDKWYCKMNSDPKNNTCKRPERTQEWYDVNRARILDMITQHLEENDRESMDVECSERTADAAKEECVKKDEVLVKMGLLNLFKDNKDEEKKGGGIKQRKRNPASVLSKIEFMEMLQSDSSDLSIEASHREAETENQAKEAAAQTGRDTVVGASINGGGLVHPTADQTKANGDQTITRISGAASQACDSSAKDASGGGKECASLHQVSLTNNAAAEKKSIVKTEVAPPPILQSQSRHTGKSQVEAIELVDSDDE